MENPQAELLWSPKANFSPQRQSWIFSCLYYVPLLEKKIHVYNIYIKSYGAIFSSYTFSGWLSIILCEKKKEEKKSYEIQN